MSEMREDRRCCGVGVLAVREVAYFIEDYAFVAAVKWDSRPSDSFGASQKSEPP